MMEAVCSSEMLGSEVNRVATQKMIFPMEKDVGQFLTVLYPLHRLHWQQRSNLRQTGQRKLDLLQVLKSLSKNSTREMSAASSSEVCKMFFHHSAMYSLIVGCFIYKYGCEAVV
jgi:hypothetical protein